MPMPLCGRAAVTSNPDLAALSLLVERNAAESLAAEAVVPGVEVHTDRDVTWVVHPGHAWRNAGVMVRFTEATAADRLETMLDRYRRHGRGMGLWVSPVATPGDLARFLRVKRFRCRKHFPAMVRILSDPMPARAAPPQLTIRRVRDVKEFSTTPHPSIGAITTPLRAQALARLRALVAEPSGQIRAFVAYVDGQPVGASELFLGSESAGLIGLSVLEARRGQGIGAALLEHTCQQARESGASTMGLIATSDGERLYTRCGFLEVARFGYWYQSLQAARSKY
jgi:GNAT superfamily N-acetyltransferase